MGEQHKETGSRNVETERVSISLPRNLNEEFEEMRIALGMSRSDAIRKAMRQFLESEKLILAEDDMDHHILGTITYLEEAHVHGHSVQDASAPHKHGPLSHTHGDHSTPLSEEGSLGKKYFPPISQIEYIKINEVQHEFLDCIISTTHIHATINQCMIIIAVRGKKGRIRSLYKKLASFKTIRDLKMTISEQSAM